MSSGIGILGKIGICIYPLAIGNTCMFGCTCGCLFEQKVKIQVRLIGSSTRILKRINITRRELLLVKMCVCMCE